MNSGGASFNAPPLETQKIRGSGMFPSPSVLLNCRRPAEQEKQRAKQSILVFISFVSLLFSAFLLVRFFSAGCRSGGRFSVGSGAASVGATGRRRTVVGR
jgi:hypothetical protein